MKLSLISAKILPLVFFLRVERRRIAVKYPESPGFFAKIV
jgi:hypothetical protein